MALGLESTNENVLRYAVNKVWGLKEHMRAATVAREAGATVKTYLLIKPPFLTEREAIEDAVRSGHDADPHSDTVSFNPVNVQSRTIVDRLFRRGEYRPPWLWSVVEVLERTRDLKAHVKSHPTAGGLVRGAHNCGTCDRRVVNAIEEFSLGLRADFGDVGTDGAKVIVSHGALEKMVVWTDGKKLFVDTTMKSGVPDHVATDTIKAYNAFLERATGLTAKERGKRAQQAAKKGSA